MTACGSLYSFTSLRDDVHFEPKLIVDRGKLQKLLDALKDEVSVTEDFTACAENTKAELLCYQCS